MPELTITLCAECVENKKLRDHPDAGALDPRDVPSHWWDCQRCNAHLERYRDGGDVSCHNCGAQYNAFGQRLRDDWRDNPAWGEDDVDDLTGYELEQLAKELP